MQPYLPPLRLLIAAASAVVYVFVGFAVARRKPSKETLVALRAFQVWWFGLAVLTLFNPLMSLIDAVAGTGGAFGLRLYLLQFVLVGIMVAIGCLVYYLLFAYLGRSWVIWPTAAYVLIIMCWLMYIITVAHPLSYDPTCNGFCYEHDVSGQATSSWLGIALAVPVILATAAYFALYFRVDTAVQKRRAAFVALGLFVWFGSTLVGSVWKGTFETASGTTTYAPLSQWVYWSYLLSPLISLLASLVILVAYRLGARPKQDLPVTSGS
ncbi:MAG: hypothetical protein ACYDBQ_02965 [Thermoplasmatota archaeon]